MNNITYRKFIDWLLLRFEVYGRKLVGDRIGFIKINSAENIEQEEKSYYSLRAFFLPPWEKIHQYARKKFLPAKKNEKRRIIFGIPLFDLEALTQYAVIFANDPYFQATLRNTIIIGQSPIPDQSYFGRIFEKNILHHLKFDLYFDQNPNQTYQLFTGSPEGQKILESFGAEDYQHVAYQGPISPQGLPLYWREIKEKIKISRGSRFWKELGKTCLGCGKCSLVCPTCYCYDLKTNARGQTRREWGSCFYSEFSEVAGGPARNALACEAGGHKFLKNMEERIYNWYDHKFVRMPEEYGFVGCVQCGRCSEVCPVGINIKKNLEKIKKLKK